MEGLLIGIIMFFILISTLSIMMAMWTLTEVKAMQKSTHSIQYVPANPEFEKVTKDLEEKMNKDIFEAV